METSLAHVLAHPLTEPGGLALPPVFVAALAVLLVAGVARLAPRPAAVREPGQQPTPERGDDRLRPPQIATRVLGLLLLALSIAAGRLGATDQLDNIVTALVVGFAWPALVLASALVGDVWRWLNPWDSLARLLQPLGAGDEEEADGDVYWAVPVALAVTWYLYRFDDALAPRAIGAALIVYTLLTLAGCLVVGRQRWFARAEVFTLLLGWVALLPRGRLLTWAPPRGADVVLGIVSGGALFAVARLSTLWDPLAAGPRAGIWATLGLLGACAAVVLLLRWLARLARRHGAAGAVVAAAVPTVAAVIVAVGLARSRLLTSAQLVVILASDPFGRGWDLFGTADWTVDPNPLGNPGLVWTQVLVICAGGLASAVVARRRPLVAQPASTSRDAGNPALVSVCVLVAAGVMAITAV